MLPDFIHSNRNFIDDLTNHDLGIVAIGRNEGERLTACLVSLASVGCPVVYVDSGSSDGSVANATTLGVTTVCQSPPGLTAARGRQAGLERLVDLWPNTEFVQFLDGDCVLQPGWIEKGLAVLQDDLRIAAVSGIRSEAFADTSIWARLVDIEWSRAEGEVRYPGGDSLCRIAALKEIGGWSCDLIAGEDPDLGFRLAEKGWKIHRIVVPMTVHDIRITKFSQYWRRAVRSGWAYALAGWRNRKGVGFTYFRQGLKFTLHAFALLVTALASIFYWPLFLLLLILLGWIVWRAGRFAHSKGLSTQDSLLYAALAIPVRFAQARGFLGAMISIASGANAKIIEYHSVPKPTQSRPQ
jgi:GT2 family glycosyltransferase